MASALPTITTPLIPTTSSKAYFDEISESLLQARQSLDRGVRALESLDKLETTMNVPEEHMNRLHTIFEVQATLAEVVGEELNALGGWLDAVEGLMQRLLGDSTKIASATATTTAVVDEKRNKEWALPSSRVRYMVVVLLLSASLLATLFALVFVSTQK
ncbi:hypothetical protein KCU77_g14622, partial [Aureobasidium melanogenum]